MVTRLTEHDDVMKPLLGGTPRLVLALGPASARADPVCTNMITRGQWLNVSGQLPLVGV